MQQELLEIAPEVDLQEIDTEEDLRDELDIDSMDLLRLTIALGKRLNTTIPDEEQDQVTTVAALMNYLTRRCDG